VVDSKSLFVGPEDKLRLYIVDDTWFEGDDGNSGIISNILQIQNKSLATFDEIKNIIQEKKRINKKIAYNPDLCILMHLTAWFSNKCLSLCFCNFEYFGENFHDMNKSEITVYLDINYSYLGLEGMNYGVRALYDILVDNCIDIPKATFVFYSSSPNKVNDFIESRIKVGDTKYLRIKRLLVYGKIFPTNDQEINKFYAELDATFSHALDDSNYLAHISEFAQNITNSNFYIDLPEAPEKPKANAAEKGKNKAHIVTFKDIPSSLCLRDAFGSTTYGDPAESYKALYLYEDIDRKMRGKGHRPITFEILEKHMSYLGITVSFNPVKCEIKLPVQPGMVFLINLKAFIDKIVENENYSKRDKDKIDSNPKRRVAISALTNDSSNIVCVSMEFYLENAHDFKHSFYARKDCGDLVSAFKDLLTCSKNTFVLHEPTGKGKVLGSQWYLEYINKRTPQLFMVPEFSQSNTNSLIVKWTYEK